jgi:hypothetical protein
MPTSRPDDPRGAVKACGTIAFARPYLTRHDHEACFLTTVKLHNSIRSVLKQSRSGRVNPRVSNWLQGGADVDDRPTPPLRYCRRSRSAPTGPPGAVQPQHPTRLRGDVRLRSGPIGRPRDTAAVVDDDGGHARPSAGLAPLSSPWAGPGNESNVNAAWLALACVV